MINKNPPGMYLLTLIKFFAYLKKKYVFRNPHGKYNFHDLNVPKIVIPGANSIGHLTIIILILGLLLFLLSH